MNLTHDQIVDEISRMVGECADEYPVPLAAGGGTLADRARWLLQSSDPPINDDAELCHKILDGSAWA